MRDVKFDYDDILILPETVSKVASRADVNPYTIRWGLNEKFDGVRSGGMLPIMAAPMDSVLDANNWKVFVQNGIYPCLPRFSESTQPDIELVKPSSNDMIDNELARHCFSSVGIAGIDAIDAQSHTNVLIDTANGHMELLIEAVKAIKSRNQDITIMVGNIANPDTMYHLAKAGADYVRLSIGTGSACTTGSNVGVGMSLGSLVRECYMEKRRHELPIKLVADGGIKNFADVNKALALGADRVMIGSLFSRTLEACAKPTVWGIPISNDMAAKVYRKLPVYKKYRGMSTKEVQRNWKKTTLRTSEGIVRYNRVEYSLSSWAENMEDYLRSAMSYTNSFTLDEFIGEVSYTFVSDKSYKRYYK